MQSLPSKFIFFLLMLSTKLHIKADNDRQEQHDPTMLEMLTTGYIPDGGVVVRHHTTLGIIQGLQESSVGGASVVSHYYAFRGIPYADSPDGDLRFSDPVDAVESWPNRYLDATRYGNVCLQVDPTSSKILGEEDCLFLNVFTPLLTKTENPSNGDGLPVLVFIHGGGFLRGSSLGLAGGRLTSQNIVLVTMNYRLGALGFLSSGDTTIPGNFGLLDQLSALRWVQRNIAQFGGDPNRVTLGGFSAGATSVHSHLLSPLAKDLFHGSLMASGSAFSPFNIQKNVLENVKQFAEKIHCHLTSSVDLKNCLLNKTPREILRTQASLLRYEYWPMLFTPVVDTGFRTEPYLPAPARDLLPIVPVPVLLSIVPQEGIFVSLNTILYSNEPTNAEAVYNQVVRDTISSFWFDQEKAKLVAEIAETFYYTKEAKSSLNTLFEQLAELFTDFMVTAWSWETAESLAEAGCPVYVYMLTHRDPETPGWTKYLYEAATKDLKIYSTLLDEGVSHGDDLALLFSKGTFKSDKIEKITQLLVSNWANFVSKGSPLIPKEIWPPVQAGGPVLYYNVSTIPHMSKSPFKQKESNFWRKTIPYIEKTLSPKEQNENQGLTPWILGAIFTYFLLSFMNRQQFNPIL